MARIADKQQSQESTALKAAHEFARRVGERYPVRQAILFGSNARGTQRPDSDVDVAIVLGGPRRRFLDTKLEMVDIAFDILLETSVYIQPLPLWEDQWARPDTHSNPRLLENIQREGIAL